MCTCQCFAIIALFMRSMHESPLNTSLLTPLDPPAHSSQLLEVCIPNTLRLSRVGLKGFTLDWQRWVGLGKANSLGLYLRTLNQSVWKGVLWVDQTSSIDDSYFLTV